MYSPRKRATQYRVSGCELRLRDKVLNKQAPPSNSGAVRPARGPRYGRGSRANTPNSPMRRASESDDPIYQRAALDSDGHARGPGRRNTIHSVLTALPILMLLIGLWFAHNKESAQTAGAPLRAESVQVSGVYEGVSLVQAGGSGRHYLWLEVAVGNNSSLRGYRLSLQQAQLAREQLKLQQTIVVDAAPTVQGSDTHWLWRLSSEGEVLLDDSAKLR